MIKSLFIRITAMNIVAIMLIMICSSVLAEENEFNGTINETNASNNAKIVTKINDSLDADKEYCINLEYDVQGRIVKVIAESDRERKTTNVVYNDDGSYTENESVTEDYEESIGLFALESSVTFLNSAVKADQKMVDTTVLNRIEEAQKVWNNAPDMRNLAHIEAEIARADYCVVYPKSSFAEAFLENGSLKNETAFRRVMKYTSPQMYGSDIMALQRALIAYGYLESTDVKPEDYGYFGPSTKAAVEDYQADKGLSVDGSVGNNTIKKLFSAGIVNNKGQVTFEGLNKINVFRTKHNMVCKALGAKVTSNNIKDIIYEAYISNAGLKGNGGRADVVKTGISNYVWEVKPDSAYGKATGGPQVTTYVERSNDPDNKGKVYCPLVYGYNITPFSFNWNSGTQIYVSSTCNDGSSARGVVYYSDRKGNQPIYQPAYSPVFLPKPNDDYAKISWPEPKTVCNGLIAAGVVVTTYLVIKGVIAIAAATATGGTSLILLCF